MFYQTSSELWRYDLRTLGIMGAIRGTSTEKLYQELGFESLKDRRWLRRLYYLYKIVNTKQPAYLFDLILLFQRSSRNKGCIYEPSTVFFKTFFTVWEIALTKFMTR